MKINKVTIGLLLIIFLLSGYIMYDKLVGKNENSEEETIETHLVDTINLEYLNVYLTSNGMAYIQPLNKNEITKLDKGNNLKNRLSTLYDRAFYYDIYIDNIKLKGYKIELDDKIKKIKTIELDDNIYIIFIKENNTIGLFNYNEYYDLLYTDVIDNYNNYMDILDVEDNKLVHLDRSTDELYIKN